MNQSQLYFLAGTISLPTLIVALHAIRVRITLGPLFGVAGIYSLMLLQLLQTGWWVSFYDLQFNTALTLFIPALIFGFLLTFALDGLRPARAYMLMVLTTSGGGWLFSIFRENLAQQVPLPYLIVLSNREHLAIIVGILLAQFGGMTAYTLIKRTGTWLALPGGLATGVLIWLFCYSSIVFDFAMSTANLRNEWYVFLIAALPSIALATAYGWAAQRLCLFMPLRAWRHLFSFWRATQSDDSIEPNGDAILNRDHIISELKLLNRQLADSGHLMETHMREASYGIIIADERGRIMRTNRPACESLEVKTLEGIGAHEALSARISGIGTLDNLVSTGEGTRHIGRTLGFHEKWFEIQATRLKGEGQSAGYYIILKDVTKIVEKEHRQLVSSRVRDLYQTGRVLTHDFSNLLIGAQAQLAHLKESTKEVESQSSLSVIESALKRAREMLQQLGTGIQFGTPKLSSLRLSDLINESVSIVSALAQSYGVAIEISMGSGDKFRVEADANQMIRVFTNLVKNAIRASPPGSPIEITAERKGKGVQVIISDHGVGMTSAQLGMAFDPGFSTKDGGQGGLGLAISYLMIEAHGGSLELRANKHGRGISALVWLPAVCEMGPLDAVSFENLAGHSVILAMPQPEASEDLATELQLAGCQQVAEVYTQDELEALIRDDPSWQIVLVAPDFPQDDLATLLQTSLDIRFLKDPYHHIDKNVTSHPDRPI